VCSARTVYTNATIAISSACVPLCSTIDHYDNIPSVKFSQPVCMPTVLLHTCRKKSPCFQCLKQDMIVFCDGCSKCQLMLLFLYGKCRRLQTIDLVVQLHVNSVVCMLFQPVKKVVKDLVFDAFASKFDNHQNAECQVICEHLFYSLLCGICGCQT